nr:tRNA epoxyqueuosine(34) reductase QueG [Armatimonadota bacterium]
GYNGDVALSSQALKDVAVAEGFDAAGVCDAGPPQHLDAYLDWVNRGLHAGMGYMKTSVPLRSQPSSLLRGTKSVLAVSLNYNRNVDRSVPRIARYALGRDYHKVLRGKLRKIMAWAEKEYPGLRARPCVDSAPVLERDFAYQAGIGWFGKNTMLIDTRRGSWFFIGLLLLSERFEPDVPANGGCGTCHACIDACPTGALVMEPGRPVAVMHSERCISYRTIEHRGDLAGNTHGWLFGCDICQEVCPFNMPRTSSPMRGMESNEQDFLPRTANLKPNLHEILEMDRDAFSRTYSGTPFMRAGLERTKRNARAILQPLPDHNR